MDTKIINKFRVNIQCSTVHLPGVYVFIMSFIPMAKYMEDPAKRTCASLRRRRRRRFRLSCVRFVRFVRWPPFWMLYKLFLISCRIFEIAASAITVSMLSSVISMTTCIGRQRRGRPCATPMFPISVWNMVGRVENDTPHVQTTTLYGTYTPRGEIRILRKINL